MKTPEIVVIGPATLDIIKDRIYLGGPPSFAGKLLQVLKANFKVIGIAGKNFPFEYYYKENIKKYHLIKTKTNNIHMMTFQKNGIKVIKPELSEKITVKQLPKEIYKAKYILLSPSNNEYTPKFMRELRKKTKAQLIIDPFGNDNKKYTKKEIDIFKQATKSFEIIKLAEAEAERALKCKGLKKIRNKLNKYNNLFLITLAERGVLLYQKNKYNKIIKTIKPYKKVEDDVGSGDVLLAGFMYMMIKKQKIENAILYGNIAATLAIDIKGIESIKTKKDIEKHYNKLKKVIT